MAANTLQPSEYDIRREVEALRDIRRRSVTPGALTIDLDLPNQSPPSSPTSYRLTSPSDESSSESASGSGTSDSSEGVLHTPHSQANDTFPLFQSLWVPASVHPEIAPAEFRAFLKEHARLSPSSEDASGPLGRSGSFSSLSSSSGLGRKKSMLSRQYRPDEHDGVENENIVPLRRNRSSFYQNQGPQLTFDDLQKLEQLAAEALVNDDPSRLRDALRRSLSMNVPPLGTSTSQHTVHYFNSHGPLALGKVDEIPNMVDEADAPIIVPPPGQILRRAARTKIRKSGPPGESGGPRFGGSRRKPTRAQTALIEPRSSDDISSSDHGDSVESGPVERPSMHLPEEGFTQRPESFSEETSIFDAYAREDSDENHTPVSIGTSPPPTQIDLSEESQPTSEIQLELLEALGPVIHHPRPQRLLSPQPPVEQQQPSRTPSPPEPSPLTSSVDRPPLSQSPPAAILTPTPSFPTTTSPPPARKEKDKKGLFGKWGGEKSSKKWKQKDSENKERATEKEKEKDSGFFISLFGSKKKQEEVPPPLLSPGQSGRETAQALLGAPKSKVPISPGLSSGIGPNNYSRYPIHVERAIYRLSHIKLANPRRPLYEQVLISNLMFWYLGVINKTQNPQPTPTVQAQMAQPPTGSAEIHTDDAEAERERREQEQQELRERAERERQEKERMEREMEMKKKESGRKGSLTKPMPAGGRRAEMPVKGPQYEMQHREMQQEYNGYNGQSQQGGSPMYRSSSAPANNANSQPQYQRNPQQYNSPKSMQPQATHPGDIFYYTAENLPQQSRLPPGAMSPEQQMWPKQQSPVQGQSSPSPPSSPVRPRSPPARMHGRYNPDSSQERNDFGNGTEPRTPARSLSATAVQTQPMPNGKVRKVNSAYAAIPGDRRDPDTGANGEEEDIPLAMWQQQWRR